MKRAIGIVTICALLSISNYSFAQETSEQGSSVVSPVIKMSGISPTVGASFSLGGSNSLRALGFLNVSSSGYNFQDSYHLYLSYLRETDWIRVENVGSYFGFSMGIQFEDPVIGPGLLMGSSYNLNDHFSIFGEVGFSAFIFDDGDNAEVGLLNSGIGLKLNL